MGLVPLRHKIDPSIARINPQPVVSFAAAERVAIWTNSSHWSRLWKLPAAVDDFLSGSVQPHRVIPARYDRQAVRSALLAAAELYRDRTIRVCLCGEIVQRIGVKNIFLKKAFGIVQANRPETIDRYVFGR